MSDHVRPTRRALHDLGVEFPPVDIELHAVVHPLVQKAQAVPAEIAAGGAERIRMLADYVWFKVKTRDLRGAAAEFPVPEDVAGDGTSRLPASGWWLAAAGSRQGDTPARDFYARLEDECRRAAAGSTQAVSSMHLKPTPVDYRRWQVESAAIIAVGLRRKVREAIARSAQTGMLWVATIGTFRLGALVKHADGETYLAVTAEGFWDHRLLAVILDAVPGVSAQDWQIEPRAVDGVPFAEGQLVYSTLVEADALAAVLEEIDDHFL